MHALRLSDAGTVWTIGHSTHPIAEFTALLAQHGVTAIADVRRHAGSRAQPQFNPEPFMQSLAAAGIDYVAFPELGGRRRVQPGSSNVAWRNASFRGYADYMATPEFAAGILRLAALARERPTAFMCAEALWWQCHRGLVADRLKSEGWEVLHIGSRGELTLHPYTAAARIVDGRLDYGGQSQLPGFGGPGHSS